MEFGELRSPNSIFSALLSARVLVKKKELSDNQELKNTPPYNHP